MTAASLSMFSSPTQDKRREKQAIVRQIKSEQATYGKNINDAYKRLQVKVNGPRNYLN
jgi:hypothetical protein